MEWGEGSLCYDKLPNRSLTLKAFESLPFTWTIAGKYVITLTTEQAIDIYNAYLLSLTEPTW